MSVEVNQMQNQEQHTGMSAGGKEPGGMSRAKANWQNICKLYRVQWEQAKAGLMMIAGAAVLLCILGIVLYIFVPMTGEEALDYVTGIPDLYSGAVMATMIYSFVMGMAVVTNPAITMLPGTVRNRFISKILYDVSILVLGLASISLVHLVNVGVVKLLASKGIIGVGKVLFDFSVFARRMVFLLAVFFLLYQSFVFFVVLSTRLGAAVTIAVIGAVMLFVTASLFTGTYNIAYGMLRAVTKAVNYLVSGQSLLRIFGAALIFLLLSYGVVLSMRSWPQDSKVLKFVQAVAVYGLVMVVTFAGFMPDVEIEMEGEDWYSEMDVVEQSRIETSILEEDLAKQKVIVSDGVITPGQVDAQVLNESFFENQFGDNGSMGDLSCSLGWCEYEEAKRCGLISKDTSIPEGSMLVRIVAGNDRYAGTYIYEDFIHDLDFDIVNGKYKVTLPDKELVYDDFMDSMDVWQSFNADKNSVDKKVSAWSTLELVQIYIVYHNGDMIHEEDLEKFNMSVNGLPWYIEDAEDGAEE